MSQAGRGWTVHLGRLLEPDTFAEWSSRPLDVRDRGHNFHEEWIFVEPDGTERHFHSTLHGEAASGALYTRDGSYYRLTFPSSSSATMHMPNGVAYTFARQASWPDNVFNPDPWRLVSITDPSNNVISINYQGASWTITDRYNRVQTIKWETDPWFGGRVDQVVVTTFGGTNAVYDFSYTLVNFERWNAFRTGRIAGSHGQLDTGSEHTRVKG
jgi:hypothetical protein